MAGMPAKVMRWTIENAAMEFALAPLTIGKRLRQESIEAGEDSRYSTAQIVKAIFGDNESVSRVKLNQAKEVLAQLDIEKAKGERMPLPLVMETYDKILSETIQLLKSAKLDPLIYADIVNGFRQFPARVKKDYVASLALKKETKMDDPMF